MNKFRLSVFAVIASLALFSCGGSGERKTENTATTPVETKPTEPPVTSSSAPLSQDIMLEGNDQMRFNATEFRVKAGEPVHLTLKHVGTMKKDVMGHNVVVLKMGSDLHAFDTEAIKAKSTDYIPKSLNNEIIAHTKLLSGGESDSITFTLDKPGTYEFLCSFPGHATFMKGKIIAE
ncbi:blue (type 1) copper domain protein [Pseudopedobacter saltans DSM 12145]|uniref:Blue (Type 1) copper domain protein n=1 Tax=Pseudopedobacter saltans (strain ATCC 51119 / DSM 12145 / JCM 21818 / CCUG 39354 / LMG 10337 / NBRC 100064 / NCIMB 13643) TaxID=762903 RepID=F0SBX7_PSESL|nr:azurin [Pseudopedobacter saltans]ADY53818.1 blue (type 1) copper domain protein [Pseudopedobacter saltans DSM 12145]